MPSTTEMLFNFGVGDRVVGVSRFCDVPLQARNRPNVGSGLDPDIEVILNLNPDLVTGTIAQRGLPFVRALQRFDIAAFWVDDTTLDTLLADMVRLGDQVGASRTARQAVENIRQSMNTLTERTTGRPECRVLLVFDDDPLYAAGPDTLVNSLLQAARGYNVLRSGSWVQLDREQLIQLDPEVILAAAEVDVQQLRSNLSRLSTVQAARNGRIHRLTAHGISRPGPGIAEAAWEIARWLHPELFLEDLP